VDGHGSASPNGPHSIRGRSINSERSLSTKQKRRVSRSCGSIRRIRRRRVRNPVAGIASAGTGTGRSSCAVVAARSATLTTTRAVTSVSSDKPNGTGSQGRSHLSTKPPNDGLNDAVCHPTTSRDHNRKPAPSGAGQLTGAVDVLTFTAEELVSTKLRALFQRSKGRDLFDLWLALTQMHLSPDRILEMFTPYRPDGYTADRAVENLQAKVASDSFRTDLDLLVTRWPDDYNIERAAQLVIDQLLSRI